MNPYETARLLNEYLGFHYGGATKFMPPPLPSDSGAPGFAVYALSDLDFKNLPPDARALDVGCAVGRTSFELARLGCVEVVGVDFSESFIRAAETLRVEGRLPYRQVEEGQIWTDLVAEVPAEVDRRRVRFAVGDACALDPAALGGAFDFVVALNLLCRLPKPRSFLAALPGLLKPGGQLLLATPCSWLEEYTPVKEWLGGFIDADGRAVRTLDALRAALAPDFEWLRGREVPFMLREHRRKFQLGISQASVWRRRQPGT